MILTAIIVLMSGYFCGFGHHSHDSLHGNILRICYASTTLCVLSEEGHILRMKELVRLWECHFQYVTWSLSIHYGNIACCLPVNRKIALRASMLSTKSSTLHQREVFGSSSHGHGHGHGHGLVHEKNCQTLPFDARLMTLLTAC